MGEAKWGAGAEGGRTGAQEVPREMDLGFHRGQQGWRHAGAKSPWLPGKESDLASGCREMPKDLEQGPEGMSLLLEKEHSSSLNGEEV